ncbi:trigger factor [Desulfoglaeba alkanexedens ALDC]|uniref:Trigger factor n=2 Tax=Desulfoglaeba alkanexedens TaxID=361111 RepID=A0A4P8L5P2_9BACT|nr:trigger factor [Desulfoglaeba alkanexedens ALDC]
MEMKVSVTDLSSTQKRLEIEVPANRMKQELDKRYRDLAKNVRIKGFRPGKVPRKILQSYYGKNVESEVSSQVIQETYPKAIQEAAIKPLVEADIEEIHFADEGTFTYAAIVEVSPPFELPEYKGLKIEKRAAAVTDEQVLEELQELRQRHAQLQSLEEDRPIREGDVVVVDFTPWVDDAVFERGKADDYMLEVGLKQLHAAFDESLLGRREGESFSFEIDYPADAPTKEIAGKRVRFEVTVKEVKAKILPDLDDDLAKEVGDYETLEELKEATRSRLAEIAEKGLRAETRGRIMEELVKRASFDLSPKVIDREVDFLVEQFVSQFQRQGLNIDPEAFKAPEVRAEYRPQAERNLRWRLIANRIAAQEGIELDEDELEAIYAEVARVMRTTVEKVRDAYAETPVIEQMKESKLHEKVMEFLEASAVFIEPAEGGSEQNEE